MSCRCYCRVCIVKFYYRQLRIPLNILVSKERDEEIRSKLVKKPLESYNPETGLRSHRYVSLSKDLNYLINLFENSTRIVTFSHVLNLWGKSFMR